MSGIRLICALVLVASPALAQDATHMTSCTTQAECDARADQRDMAARQAAWADNVRRNDQREADLRQMSADARASRMAGRAARSHDIMHRRAAAAAGNE